MNTGPRQFAAIAPARTEVAKSMGRWNVEVCSLRAISRMTAPTSALSAVSNTVRAMSNVWARRLIAGTVNPWTSPRPRAMYSSWMLADSAPSCWLASQTSHCAASFVASSSPNTAVHARSRIGASRKAFSSAMTSRPPSRCAAAPIAVMRSDGLVATWGIGGTLLVRTFESHGSDLGSGGPLGGRYTTRPCIRRSERRLGHHEDHDQHDQDAEEHPASLCLLDGGHELRWRTRCPGWWW